MTGLMTKANSVDSDQTLFAQAYLSEYSGHVRWHIRILAFQKCQIQLGIVFRISIVLIFQ